MVSVNITYVFCYCVENCLLLGHHVQDAIEHEVVDIIFCILVATLLSILWESKLDLIVFCV